VERWKKRREKEGRMKGLTRIGRVGALLCVVAAAGCLAGCGGGAAKPAAIKGSLTYWYNLDWDEADQKLLAAFRQAQPNIEVTATGFTYDTFVEKVRVAYAGGSESDVQQIFGDWAMDLMKNKRLSPVPKAYAGEIRTRLFDTTLGGYSFNDVLYGIPREYNIESGGVLYYPEELEKAGYAGFPKTWDELMDAARKMTRYDAKGTPIHWGFDFMTTDNVPYLFLSLILQQGGSYWAKDMVHVTFSTPEAEKAMQVMADMVLKDRLTEINHLSDATNDAYVYFFKGTSSMLYRGPWVIPTGKNDFGLESFAYGSMPSFAGGSLAFAAESGWGEVVSARSKRQDAAWVFVEFITSPGSQRTWNETTYTIPSEKSVAESPDFLETNPLIKPSLDVLKYGKPIGPLMSIDTFKGTIVKDNFTRLCGGSQDVKATLKAIEQQTNAMIDERRAQ
jgi:multiple sugar transport system substrate-binding protein